MFLPILFGCSTKVRPEGDQNSRVCPRCNNASVIQAKTRVWLELFCVPVVPMNSRHIWLCGTCQWQTPVQPGWEPAFPGANFAPGGGFRQPQPPPPSYGSSPGAPGQGGQPSYPGYVGGGAQQGYRPSYAPPPR